MPYENFGTPAELLNQTDADLVTALRTGNTAALGTLYDRHAGLVYGIAIKILKNAQEAEDLTHDVFLRLANATSYDPARSSLRTFLGVLTRSRAVDKVRSQANRSRILQQNAPGKQQSVTANRPLEKLFQQEQSQALRSALTQLAEEQQQILNLIYYKGLTQPQIAERLNLPLSTVKARGRRGLLRLRQIFKQATDYESL